MSVCAICLKEEISLDGKNICVTECGHTFCLSCILRSAQENTSCPLCRNVLVTPKNNEEELVTAYRNGHVAGYDEGLDYGKSTRLEEIEELNIRTQQEFDRGFISGRTNARTEIESLRREIARRDSILSVGKNMLDGWSESIHASMDEFDEVFEELAEKYARNEHTIEEQPAQEQPAQEQTNPRAEALRSSPNFRHEAQEQINPRAEALRSSPNFRPTWIRSHEEHGAPWQS